jgi:LacI family transcriptional regulator
MAHAIAALGVPAVDLRGLLPDLDAPSITTDDRAVAGLAVAHFLERGFRNFAFCGFINADYSDNRSRAFARLVEEAGFACHIYQPCRKHRPAGTTALEQGGLVAEAEVAHWVQALPRPVGLMACNDIRGQQILNACRDAAIAIPEDVAVLGVDNDDVLCDLSNPTMSSVIPDTRRIGFEAAAMLERMIGGEPPPTKATLIPPLGVVTRRSTDVLAIEDRDLAAAMRYIREHACEGITVEDVLAHVPLSRSVFERRFDRLFGRTPKAEILRARLDRLKQLLAETEMPLKQIAVKVGFEHAEYMNVFFKERTGLTPGQYRAEARQPNPKE